MNAKSIKLYLKFTRKEPPVGRLRGLGFIQLSPHGYKPGMVPDEIMGGIPFCLKYLLMKGDREKFHNIP